MKFKIIFEIFQTNNFTLVTADYFFRNLNLTSKRFHFIEKKNSIIYSTYMHYTQNFV